MTVEADARTFYADNPDIMCTCDVCNGNELNSINEVHHYFDDLTPQKAKLHYCRCRSLELKEIETSDINGILSILSKDINFCESKISRSYKIPYRHLHNWESSIQEFLKES